MKRIALVLVSAAAIAAAIGSQKYPNPLRGAVVKKDVRHYILVSSKDHGKFWLWVSESQYKKYEINDTYDGSHR